MLLIKFLNRITLTNNIMQKSELLLANLNDYFESISSFKHEHFNLSINYPKHVTEAAGTTY